MTQRTSGEALLEEVPRSRKTITSVKYRILHAPLLEYDLRKQSNHHPRKGIGTPLTVTVTKVTPDYSGETDLDVEVRNLSDDSGIHPVGTVTFTTRPEYDDNAFQLSQMPPELISLLNLEEYL